MSRALNDGNAIEGLHGKGSLFPGMKKMNFIKTVGSCIRYCWVLPVSCIGIVLLPFVIFSGGTVVIAAGVIEAEGGIAPSCCPASARISDRCHDHRACHYRPKPRKPYAVPETTNVFTSDNTNAGGRSFRFCISCQAQLPWSGAWIPYRDNRFEQEAFRVSGAGMTAQRADAINLQTLRFKRIALSKIPCFMPRLNQRTLCSELPWVKDSGTT